MFAVRPLAPRCLTIVVIKKTEIQLQWSAPESHENYGVMSYVIEYQKSVADWQKQTTNCRHVICKYIVTGLESSTVYSFKVSAVNHKGVGISTDILMAKTSGKGYIHSPSHIE